eukprot:1883622-Heterocapsa_arctica.AAC.1
MKANKHNNGEAVAPSMMTTTAAPAPDEFLGEDCVPIRVAPGLVNAHERRRAYVAACIASGQLEIVSRPQLPEWLRGPR